ncbi:hypothetical protein CYMTET_56273 [Cymbomonas tetramitiformis]|uniref:Flagellar associated protein n=1 Tax=Cymbomonas tetramitiformis TaxID=36881 RepID=A0AAE0BCP6_9CHLO|nr:hypothetical protein CYMTET_56273 [Cymbomonas tetramitiformis]
MVGMAGIYHKGIGMDNHHKGIGQAGNKSMMSYRVDSGIPGYAGYIPTTHSIQLPTKGSTVHTGRHADEATLERRVAKTYDDPYKSEYNNSLTAKAGDYKTPQAQAVKNSGHWQTLPRGEFEANKKVVVSTTYKEEVQESKKHASKAHVLAEDLRPTLATHIAAQNLSASGKLKNKEPGEAELGFYSEYTSMVVREPQVGGPAAAGNLRSRSLPHSPAAGGPDGRRKVIQRTLNPPFNGLTTYAQNHGAYGSDPLSNSAKHESEISKRASTAELQKGTVKNTSQIPGYSGFVPEAQHNSHAITHALGQDNRPLAKDKMLLCSLDQYSRHTVPGLCAFRQQAPHSVQLQGDPVKESTQGLANFDCWKKDIAIVDKANHLTAKYGTQSFFTPGQTSISDNGKSAAERFYHVVRPREGLPRIHYPSQTTDCGSVFKN